MKAMKKAQWFLMLVATVTAIALLVGCSCDKKPDNGKRAETQPEQTTAEVTEAATETEAQTETAIETETETETETMTETETQAETVSEEQSETAADTETEEETSTEEETTEEIKTICFGAYPQSQVTDTELISALTDKAGDLPTAEDAQAFTSYGYYENGVASDYMWYIDVDADEERYRGVYFTSYRPSPCGVESWADNTAQDENGYEKGALYWFKYEPIQWHILSRTGETALLFADLILDSQQFDFAENGDCDNNYAASTIRAWLNDTFYQTAFSLEEQAKILTTTVENGAETTGDSGNTKYACENTEDKVFLLSYEQITDVALGFEETYYTEPNATRQKKSSDYAKAQGVDTATDEDCAGSGCWWLRSPAPAQYSALQARGVYYRGAGNDITIVSWCNYGVVPAVVIAL